MTNIDFLLYFGIFTAGFGIGFMNMACGDLLGLKRVYRAVGLMK